MGDPVERIRLFVEDQQQQTRTAIAQAAWNTAWPRCCRR